MTEKKSDQNNKPQGIYFSLSFKLILGFTLIFSLVFGLAYFWFYTFATDKAVDRVEKDLRNTLFGAVEQVNVDKLESLLADVPEPAYDEEGNLAYPEDERYWELSQKLYEVFQIENRAYAYTFIAKDENTLTFLTSVGAVFPEEKGGQFGVKYREDCGILDGCLGEIDTNLRALRGEEDIVFQDIYSDSFGEWISGFAPIRNDEGEVIAAMGVDFEANYIKEVQQDILDSILVAFMITYLSLFILVYFLSTTLTRPIRSLTDAAKAIGEGNYNQDLSNLYGHRFRDEIDTLATVFTDMSNKVYQREEKLKKQVAELKIKIDEDKAAEQVSKIVETDFFEDLQAKAADLRNRRRETEERKEAKRKSSDEQD